MNPGASSPYETEPDYAQGSACDLESMGTRARVSRKPVIRALYATGKPSEPLRISRRVVCSSRAALVNLRVGWRT